MNNSDKQNIVILGGGTAGWVSAAVLSKQLISKGHHITLVESEHIPSVGVGEASIPAIYELLNYLEVDDSILIKEAEATFKYGIHFENWSALGHSYMHSFGQTGTPYNDIDFIEFWLKNAKHFTSKTLTPFAPAAIAAYQGKFIRQLNRPQNAPSHAFFPLCNLCYALHFDAGLLASFLKRYAIKQGVMHIQGLVSDVNHNEQGITSLVLNDGQLIEGDLFIDCSGIYGKLIKKTLNAAFEDWSHYLPCDTAITVQTTHVNDPVPYTKSIAKKAGWCWEIPLQNRVGNGYVYSSQFISDEEAKACLLDQVKGELLTDIKKIPFTTGRLKTPWYKNCVAIGLSSGFLEPLESTSIHLIAKSALLLKDLLLQSNAEQVMQQQFNEQHLIDTEQILNFLVMHYYVNQRTDSPFWLHCQSLPLPNALIKKLESFKSTGRISLGNDELFGYGSWYQVLIGQQFINDYSGFYDEHCLREQSLNFMANVSAAIQAEVKNIPLTHAQYIKQIKSAS